MRDDCSVSNGNNPVAETLNSIANPIFIQNLKLHINRDRSGDGKLKGHEIAQCVKMLTALNFY